MISSSVCSSLIFKNSTTGSQALAYTVYSTANGGNAADELRDMLGKPLSQTERLRALEIVRAGDGVQRAIETAKSYVQLAEAECNRMPQGEATDALRAAPGALLSSVIR